MSGWEVRRVIPGCALVLVDGGRQFRSISSFKDYQSLIDLNRHFFRCHESYVVNLSHVAALEQNSFNLSNGDTVNICRCDRDGGGTLDAPAPDAGPNPRITDYERTIRPPDHHRG